MQIRLVALKVFLFNRHKAAEVHKPLLLFLFALPSRRSNYILSKIMLSRHNEAVVFLSVCDLPRELLPNSWL
jgi:hypothetical protein